MTDLKKAAAALGRKGGKAKVPKGFAKTDASAAGKKGARNRWSKQKAEVTR